MMSREQWSSVRKLLDDALDNPAMRPALMARLQDHDPELCAELQRLIAEIEGGEDESEQSEPTALDLHGRVIGPYTIVREIGRGGSGTVMLATREEAGIRVETALKFLERDFLRGAPRRTFQRELRALARLDHPNIARLRDWGTVSEGIFYLAIEYVAGENIAAYCARKRLGVAARLGLFLQVCNAVEHAHCSLVVHRDLKPSNILVTDAGVVKLLDFGIAAELDSRAEPTTVLQRALTPSYASPEQIAGHPVSVATDVYSLGLVLYELLAGRLPQVPDGGKFWAAPHEEAVPPSKCALLAEISARQIAGDLDDIALKAIRKNPGQRYPSVQQFAADIRRHCDGRPVLARHASRLYIAGRFLRRNRLQIAVASLAVAALAATAGVAVWKWHDAGRNLAEAQRDYQELRTFAQDMIANVDAGTAASQSRLSETVVRYLGRLSKGRQNDQELQLQIAAAYIHLGLAQGQVAHPNLGEPAGAVQNFDEAYRISLRQWRANASRKSGIVLLNAALESAIARPASGAWPCPVEFSWSTYWQAPWRPPGESGPAASVDCPGDAAPLASQPARPSSP